MSVSLHISWAQGNEKKNLSNLAVISNSGQKLQIGSKTIPFGAAHT